jgi:hypothetical protein
LGIHIGHRQERREQSVTTKEQFSDEEGAKVAAVPGLVVVGAGISGGYTLPALRG